MERITYKCDKGEARLPLAQRKKWHVYLGSNQIATITASEEPSSNHSHSLRIWKAKMYDNAFDPFDFPHHPDDHEEEEKTKPHVTLHDSKPMLVNPQPMTMQEARSWIKHVVQRGSQ